MSKKREKKREKKSALKLNLRKNYFEILNFEHLRVLCKEVINLWIHKGHMKVLDQEKIATKVFIAKTPLFHCKDTQ